MKWEIVDTLVACFIQNIYENLIISFEMFNLIERYIVFRYIFTVSRDVLIEFIIIVLYYFFDFV